jgi:hypothetical protein
MIGRLGYYIVNDKIFEEKLDAILYANETRADVGWYYHDTILNAVDWSIEPETSLDEFYKIRAQQIRDEYDYIVIMCSGGADSTNVVWSFLNNGIHVDEVVASAPMSGLRNWNDTTNDQSASNTMSETVYAQLPLLNEIKTKHPTVKISINDYFENIINFKTDEWLFRGGEWIHPSGVARYNLEQLTHLRNMAESGKKIGIIYGIDKPSIKFIDNEVQTNISDLAVNVQRQAFDKKYSNVENVLFYYSYELPQMMIKQAHQVAKWVALPENADVLKLVFDNKKHRQLYFAQNRLRHSLYERAIVPCIYPSTHRSVFQGAKPTRMFLGEHDDWFYKLHSNTRMFEMVESDFRNFIKSIDPKYLNQVRTGFTLYIKSFTLGTKSKFFPLV